jgi:tetratricopeptide (TPR) repeat protein
VKLPSLAALLLLAAQAQASEGAAYLKIPQGAASTAMGSARVALRGMESMWYTPAGLAGIESIDLSFSRMAWLGQTRNDYLAAVLPVGAGGGLGAWVNSIGTEDTYRDAFGNDGGKFNVGALSGGLAYGVRWNRVSFGLAAKYFQERIESVAASSYAGDFGMQIELLHSRKWRLGFAVQNMGPNLNYDTASTSTSPYYYSYGSSAVTPPRTYRGGMAFDHLGDIVTLVQEVRLLPDSLEMTYLLGGELDFKVGLFKLAARAGYESMASYEQNSVNALSVGGGVQMQNLKVDFAYLPYGSLGAPYRMSLGWQFDVSRPIPAPLPKLRRRRGEEADGRYTSVEAAWAEAERAEAGGGFARAREAYEEAIKMEPQNPEVWGRLGKFEFHQDNKGSAVKAFEVMLTLRPDEKLSLWLKDYKGAAKLEPPLP